MAFPTFNGAEIIGDSMMLRFSLRHADTIPYFKRYPSSWGMCRSGKRAAELLREGWPNNTITGKRDRAIIMIGTNDVLHICWDRKVLARHKNEIKQTMWKVMRKALNKYRKVYFCTVPEIPRLCSNVDRRTRGRYNNVWQSINAKILSLGKISDSVTPIDLRGLFNADCYEKFMGSGATIRFDGIHLNRKGQDVLKEVLLKVL